MVIDDIQRRYITTEIISVALLLLLCPLGIGSIRVRVVAKLLGVGPALPLLGFSPKILGFSIQSWVLRFFLGALGFF